MKEEVLFQITKENLDTGLRGIPVGHCPTSTVHPEKGLFYVDHPIAEIASWAPEEAIYLLYKGKKGNTTEVEAFSQDLKKRGSLSSPFLEQVRHLPKQGDPMKLFSMAILLLGMLEGKKDYREDCLDLIAKIPYLTALVINHHAGWGGTPRPDPILGYMENFAAMLNVPKRPSVYFTEVLRLFNVLHYDHGGGNLSTFVGKAVASGLEDLYGSIAASMCALAGPRHGRANQEALEFVTKIYTDLGENPKEEELEKYLKKILAEGGLVFGFGHAVLRVEDPRATVQYKFAEHNFGDYPLVKIALKLRKVGAKVLKENPKISDPYSNVDAISGTLLSAAGFPYPAYYTLLFGLARAVGISIQIVYERLEARDGKGTPIVRPKYLYQPRTVSS